MDGDVSWAILGAVAGALLALALVALVSVLRRRSRPDLVGQLEASQREADDLRQRLDVAHARLQGRTGRTGRRQEPAPDDGAEQAPFVITDVGLLPEQGEPVDVPDRWVLSATLGGPLVKAAALAHGVRRALSAESRNRIRFQMRQEVRAARKRRRLDYKQYQRDVRAAEREAV